MGRPQPRLRLPAAGRVFVIRLSHSCEGRNLFARQRKRRIRLRRMRFRLSPEWCIFIFSDTAKFGIVRKTKSAAIPAKAGISAPKGAKSENCEVGGEFSGGRRKSGRRSEKK
ncbi:MAG: hypothetical protein ACR2QC_11525 [Gammaproteobacteria bacterium]